MSGYYTYCACRDCAEIAVGESGEAFCHACEDAGCEGDGECEAEGAYGCNKEPGSEPEPAFCPLDGCEGVPLGALGNLMHYRCRGCGMNFSHSMGS